MTSKDYSDDNHRFNMLEQLRKYSEEGKSCDVTLVAGIDRVCVAAHRLVLSAASPYFATMFASGFRESREADVTIEEVDGDVLQLLVGFCYTGRLQMSAETATSLLKTAHLLSLSGAVDACCDYLGNNLDFATWTELATISEILDCAKLKSAVYSYAKKSFPNFIDSKHFLDLSAKHLAQIVASDELNVRDEDIVFKAVLRWLDHDFEGRTAQASELLHLVRYGLMEPKLILEQVKSVFTKHGIQDQWLATCGQHMLPVKGKRAAQKNSYILRFYVEAHTLVFEHWLSRKEWEMFSRPDTRCFGVSRISHAMPYNSQLIFIGNKSFLNNENNVGFMIIRINFETKTGKCLYSTEDDHLKSAAIWNNVIYFSTEHSKSIKCFNLVLNALMPDVHAYLESPTLCIVDGKLIAHPNEAGANILCYDIEKSTYQFNVKSTVSSPLMCGSDGVVYIVGGHDSNTNWVENVQRLEIATACVTTVGTIEDELNFISMIGDSIFCSLKSGEAYGYYNVRTNLFTKHIVVNIEKETFFLHFSEDVFKQFRKK